MTKQYNLTRSIKRLYHHRGFTVSEISSLTDIPEKDVKKILNIKEE